MRRFLLAVFFAAATATTVVEAATQLSAPQGNVAGKIQDLNFRITGLTFPAPSDLVFRVQDMAGAAQPLQAATQPLQVQETNTEIRISLSADILFDFDKSNILPKAADALKNVAGMISDHPGAAVRIEGYTDAKGKDAYNQKLSGRRANSVRDWLIKTDGLKGVTFTTKGFGAKNPVAPNTNPDGSDNPEGRQKNRRVEIVIEKV